MGDGFGSELTRQVAGGESPAATGSPFARQRPHVVTEMVERQALVGRLLAFRSSLVVLSAPAGSGKTTVLLEWTGRSCSPCAWLQVEAGHNTPVALVSDLASVLHKVVPVESSVRRWCRLPVPPLQEKILPSLKASLAEAMPFLLVLDDAHLLKGKASWDLIDTLHRVFPSGAQLAIGSRTEPRMALGRAEAAGKLLQIGADDLAFSVAETAELLRLRGLEADEKVAEALQIATEGWAAGISLAALACDKTCTSELVSNIDGRQKSIARYLISEVLERQTHRVRSFLLETSILERLSEGSCRAVTGRADSGKLLADLSRDNLFVTPMDDKGEWYRYHHLFAGLLRSELARRDGARVSELHRRAAVWAEGHRDLELAVRHWLDAGEVERAGDVVCLGHVLYSGRGQVETVRRWVELFTDEQIRSYVPLALVAGTVAAMVLDPAPEWTSAMLEAVTDDSPMPHTGGTTRAWQTLQRALIASDGVGQMLADAESAAELAEGSHPAWRAAAGMLLGGARWLSGDIAGAERAYRQVVADGHTFNPSAEIAALGYLSLLLADHGRWEEAEREALTARQRLDELELGVDDLTLGVLIGEVRVAAHQGVDVSSGRLADIEERLAAFRLPDWVELLDVLAFAKGSLELGDVSRAEHWIKYGKSVVDAWPDRGAVAARLEYLRRALCERMEVEGPTRMELRILSLLASRLTRAEMARCLVLSENTVNTHVRDLYRKLGVHSRSEAVVRATQLGLL